MLEDTVCVVLGLVVFMRREGGSLGICDAVEATVVGKAEAVALSSDEGENIPVVGRGEAVKDSVIVDAENTAGGENADAMED